MQIWSQNDEYLEAVSAWRAVNSFLQEMSRTRVHACLTRRYDVIQITKCYTYLNVRCFNYSIWTGRMTFQSTVPQTLELRTEWCRKQSQSPSIKNVPPSSGEGRTHRVRIAHRLESQARMSCNPLNQEMIKIGSRDDTFLRCRTSNPVYCIVLSFQETTGIVIGRKNAINDSAIRRTDLG